MLVIFFSNQCYDRQTRVAAHVRLKYFNPQSLTFYRGDMGYVDEDDCFYIVDRLKELIKYKGMQVAPAELEVPERVTLYLNLFIFSQQALLLSHPSVDDAAVIPFPDDEAGEVPKAFVVVKPGHKVTAGDIQSFVKSRVATYKQIRIVEFIDKIPKSPSGKILRRTLVPAKAAPHLPHQAKL